MTLKTLITCITILFVFSQCGKKPVKPPVSSSRYLKCTVNGQEWIAATPTSISGPAAITVDYNEQTGDFSVTACRQNQTSTYFESINYYCPQVLQPGDFQLYTGDGDFQAFVDYAGNYSCGIYYHDENNPGNLNITKIDTVQHIIAGTFGFTAFNSDCTTPSLSIENGHFSVKYQ